MKVYIAGTTGFSEMISQIVTQESQYEVVGFCTKKELIREPILDGKPVVDEESLSTWDGGILLTIGYSHMNTLREKVFFEYESRGFNIVSYVSSKANVYSKTIGKGSLILPGAFIGPDCRVGNGCVVYTNVQLTHHINVGDFSFIGSGCVIGGNVNIGHNSFIGMNSTIRNKACLAPYTLAGCGSNVLKSVNTDCGVVVGNPAKLLNKNSMEVQI